MFNKYYLFFDTSTCTAKYYLVLSTSTRTVPGIIRLLGCCRTLKNTNDQT